MPSKRNFSTFNYGPPTDSDVEPEIIIRRGTRTRCRSPEYRSLIDFSTIVPTVQDLTAIDTDPELVDLTASSPALIDLTIDLTTSPPTPPTITTTSRAIAPIFVEELDMSDLSGDEESVASTVLLPQRNGKKPMNPQPTPARLSITRPIRPFPIRTSVPLHSLPPVSSTRFYSSYDLSLEHKFWHARVSASGSCAYRGSLFAIPRIPRTLLLYRYSLFPPPLL